MPQPEKIPSAFASAGDVQKIPEVKAERGRASWNDGFPPETQIPIAAGGLAPRRKDFNGVFNALSEIALWAQQGGKFTYDAAVNYEPANIVLDGGKLYWCLKANGPGGTVKSPSSDAAEEYWKWLVDAAGALNVPKVKTLTMAEVLQKVYPVGSVYVSAVATPPATLFGFGTWEQIKDRFILAVGNQKALATGGEEKHTLAVSEMPVHTHTGTIAQGGAHTHSGTAANAGAHHHGGFGEDSNYGKKWPFGFYNSKRDYTGSEGEDQNNGLYNTTTDGAHTHTLNINSGGGHTHTLTAANAGGGAAHNNMPPYIALYVWRRTA